MRIKARENPCQDLQTLPEKGTRPHRHHNIMTHGRPEKRKALHVEVADIVEMEWKTSTGKYISVSAAVLNIVSDNEIRVLMPDGSQEIIKTCPLRGRSPKYRKLRLVREEDEVEDKEVDEDKREEDEVNEDEEEEDEIDEIEGEEDEGEEDEGEEDEGEDNEIDEEKGKEDKENNDKKDKDDDNTDDASITSQSVKGKRGPHSIFLHPLDGMQGKHKEAAHDLFDSKDTYVSPEMQCMNSCLLAMSSLPEMQPVRDAPEMSRRIRFMESQVQKLAMTLTPLSKDIVMKQDKLIKKENELIRLQQESAVKEAKLKEREVSFEEREKKLEEREKRFAQLRDLMKSFI